MNTAMKMRKAKTMFWLSVIGLLLNSYTLSVLNDIPFSQIAYSDPIMVSTMVIIIFTAWWIVMFIMNLMQIIKLKPILDHERLNDTQRNGDNDEEFIE